MKITLPFLSVHLSFVDLHRRRYIETVDKPADKPTPPEFKHPYLTSSPHLFFHIHPKSSFPTMTLLFQLIPKNHDLCSLCPTVVAPRRFGS